MNSFNKSNINMTMMVQNNTDSKEDSTMFISDVSELCLEANSLNILY